MCVQRDLRINWKQMTTKPLHAVIHAIINMNTSQAQKNTLSQSLTLVNSVTRLYVSWDVQASKL